MDARTPKKTSKKALLSARDPERTRLAILEAATVEISNKGLGGARVDAIAARSRVNKRLIYNYFGDKEGLYLAVLDAAYYKIRSPERGLALADKDPEEGMRELVQFTWEYLSQHPEFLSLVGTENMHRAAFLKRSKKIRDMHSPLIGMIADLLERGSRKGVFRSGVDPVDLYVTIAGLGWFYMSNRFTLSTIFARDLTVPASMKARGQTILEVVMAYLRP
jgi:AcrR family transcriptional regulator